MEISNEEYIDKIQKEEFYNDRTARIENLLSEIDETENEIKQIEFFMQEVNKLPIKSSIAREQTAKFLSNLKTEKAILEDIKDEFEQSVAYVKGL